MNNLFCSKDLSRFVLLIALVFNSSILANSATFTVTKTADTNDSVCDADCSLREAVAAANIATTNDVIQFDPQTFNVLQTITLMNGDLDLLGDVGSLTINGPSADLLTIDSLEAERHFNIPGNAVVTINKINLFGNKGRGSGFGGGIEIYFGTLTLNDSTIINNSGQHGGGFANYGGLLRINNSTISNNSSTASGGGINNNGGRTELINSTISNNLASSSGGGISNVNGDATVSLTNVTISNNSVSTGSQGGGGVSNNDGATIVEVYNSIIANNTSRIAPDFKGTLTSKGYNLISNTNSTTITGITIGNILGVDPMLGSLAKNGGSTSTHALVPNSPAIDAGDPASNVVTDQRGVSRPQDGDFNGSVLSDIGAYERVTNNFLVTKVTDTNDGVCNSDCSLREAIGAANTNAQTIIDTINFDAELFSSAQTIVLTLGQLQMSSGTFVINGTNANLLNISGNRQSIVFNILSEANVEINKITISEGTLGIFSFGSLMLNDSVVRNNRTNGGIYGAGNTTIINNSSIINNETGSSGAGIRNSGILVVNNSIVNNNFAYFGSTNCGGGIANLGGTVKLFDTTVSGNTALSGGGVCSQGSQIDLTRTTIKNNVAQRIGAGVYIQGGMLNLSNSSVNSNTSSGFGGGGIYNQGTTTINQSAITNNSSTVTSNVSEGGGIYNRGLLRLTNSTISENSSDDNGGGIYNATGGTVSLTNATIASNTAAQGGGIFNFFDSTVNSRNTIISNNIAQISAPDFSGILNSEGYNLIKNNIGITITGTTIGNILGVDPKLLPLGNYGGLTQTHALRSTSPAVDKGSFMSGINTDQRELPRPFNFPSISNAPGGNGSDIGAFERQNSDISGNTPFDFDGDGKADVSVFRPESGVWHLQRSQSGYAAPQFGLSTDKLVPADYDGDGKTDVAVFRENPSDPGKAKFFILQSSNNQLREEQFGATGDIPLSGDWDGDGRADIGVYRAGTEAASQGYFYYRPSSQPTVNFVPYPWGIAGDKPVVADFDGDGKSDPAVFRPSNGSWYIQRSRDGFYAIQFGASEDKPVVGDYDGDGKADQAVFRPSNGVWYLWNSTSGFSAAQFGVSTDKPVPADYDGDGKTDIAVYRDGNWFLLNSTNGFASLGFGNATDKPIANAFVP